MWTAAVVTLWWWCVVGACLLCAAAATETPPTSAPGAARPPPRAPGNRKAGAAEAGVYLADLVQLQQQQQQHRRAGAAADGAFDLRGSQAASRLLGAAADSLNIAPFGDEPVYVADRPRAPVALRFLNSSTTVVLEELALLLLAGQKEGAAAGVQGAAAGAAWGEAGGAPAAAAAAASASPATPPEAVESLAVECAVDVNPWVLRELRLRVCMRVQSTKVDPMRGTVRRSDSPRAACSPGGPRAFNMTVPALSPGRHVLSVALWDVLGERVGPPSQPVSVVVAARRRFRPSYSWAFVEAWQNVPTGMEIRLPMDGTGERMARIPDPWRVQVYLGDGEGFFRGAVGRTWTAADIRAAIARDRRTPEDCLTLRFGQPGGNSTTGAAGQAFAGNKATVEALRLFERQAELTASVARNSSVRCLCAGAVPCAHAKRLHSSCLRELRNSPGAGQQQQQQQQSGCEADRQALAECNAACGVKSDEEVAAEKAARRAAEREAADARRAARGARATAKAFAAKLAARGGGGAGQSAEVVAGGHRAEVAGKAEEAEEEEVVVDEEDDEEEAEEVDDDNHHHNRHHHRIPVVHSSSGGVGGNGRRPRALDGAQRPGQWRMGGGEGAAAAAHAGSVPVEGRHNGDADRHHAAAGAADGAAEWGEQLLKRERERLTELASTVAPDGVLHSALAGASRPEPLRMGALHPLAPNAQLGVGVAGGGGGGGRALFADIGEGDSAEEDDDDEVIDLSVFVL